MSELAAAGADPLSKKRSQTALALFILLVIPIPFCLLIYHFILWFMEQLAIASLSAGVLSRAGLIGLLLQAVIMSLLAGMLWRFTDDDRFKPIYRGLFFAALIGLPAALLRLLGPNNDQVGSIAQFLLAITAFALLHFTRKEKADWMRGSLPFGLLIGAVGFAPFAVFGSFGSFGDVLLALLAGVAFGLLAAELIESPTGNAFLDSFGMGSLLALLGSALGYDGSQLILLTVLPAFAFALAALMPSRAAAAALVAILAFAAWSMFDPTELTIVLGDIGGLASKAATTALMLGLFTGLMAWILRKAAEAGSGARTRRAIGWLGASLAWLLVGSIFFIFGHPGNYGDRLFVIMKDQADISPVEKIKDRDARLTKAYQLLTKHANETQADLRNIFDQTGVEYTPYYLENAMEVRGGTLIRLFLMTRPEVDRVIPSPRLRAVPVDEPSAGESTRVDVPVQWNIQMIGADKVWNEFNVQGEGIIVGQSDSGVDGNHPAIQKQYRGYNGSNDYNWFDPWDGSESPNDEGGHGTHTIGTILGANGIGVAPKAQWIGCVNLDRNLGNPALYLDCMQFMLAPFPQGGDPFTDGDPAKAAHVLNNSWGCPAIEGCDANALLYAADNLRHAGIFVVVSAGNDGPMCGTVESPLSLYDSVFSVGALDQFGNMADFSSRGPVTADGSNRAKPDIVAPGVDIFSSLPDGTYGSNSGTSMAGPHLVGVVALIWSAQPELIGNIDATEKLIIETASPFTGNLMGEECAPAKESNNVYGYGMVNVYEAVKKALSK